MSKYLITSFEISKIHWKSQAIANIFFGLPIAAFAISYWGTPFSGVLKFIIFYLSIYTCFNVPLWGISPHFSLRPMQKTLSKIKQKKRISKKEALECVEFFIDFPARSATGVFILVLTAFVIGVSLLYFGVIPELSDYTLNILVFGIILGLIVSTTESFLHFTYLEDRVHKVVVYIVTKHPQLIQEKLRMRRFPLFSKIFFLVWITTGAAQAALLVVLFSKIIILSPAALYQSFIYVGIVVLLTAGYVYVITNIFSKNIVRPLQNLVSWSREVTKGNLDKKLTTITNDEISEVIIHTKQMVNKLKEDSELIAAEKNKLSVVLSGIVDGVIALDREYKIIILNKAAERITAWKVKEVINRHVDKVMRISSAGGRSMSVHHYCPLPLKKKKDAVIFSKGGLKLVTKGGDEKYINLRCATIKEAEAVGLGCILMFHDLTEERELERMKLDFVSMAAHGLRTPLTVVRGYLSVLQKERAYQNFTKEEKKYFDRALIGSDHLNNLIENLLNVSRIESGQLKMSLQALKLDDLVAEVIEEFEKHASSKGLVLEFIPVKDTLPSVYGDSLQIKEVLRNLISNAINFTQKGKVEVVLKLDKGGVTVSISDTGQGIPPEAMSHLFTKFFRVGGELQAGSKGTGLGLYISKSVIDAHKGKIWAESMLNMGTTVHFSLPVANP